MNVKTIFMPEKLLSDWIKDLRSGKYKQGTLTLEYNGTYCCLAVLQMVKDGKCEKDSEGHSYGVPSRKWLDDAGVMFCGKAELHTQVPYLPGLDMYAHDANDEGYSFAQIADAIEACAETV